MSTYLTCAHRLWAFFQGGGGVGWWFSTPISDQHERWLVLHSELNIFTTWMTSPLAWAQEGWEHMPIGNASGTTSIGSTLSLCWLGSTPSSLTQALVMTHVPKMSSQMSLLIHCLSLLSWMIPSMAQWSASLAHYPKDSSLWCLDPAYSRSPWRCGPSEGCTDGHCDGSPCMWPSKQPLDIRSHITALLPESRRNIDPCCWPITHQPPHPCSTKETWQLPVLSYRLWSIQQVWGSRKV